MRALRHPVLHWVLGVLLGAAFLYASHDKILFPAQFAKIVYLYRLIGPNQAVGYLPANLLAITLPWIEAVAGLLLVVGLWRREAAAVVSGLLVVFLVAVGSTLARGIDVQNCGCFSVSADGGRNAGLLLLLEDLGMLLASLVLTLAPSARSGGDVDPREQA